jgi:Flp pilus assembly protein TadB
MTTQEIWQLQALKAPHVSAAYMRHRTRDLARRTQIRNGSNYVGVLCCALFIAWYCWRYFLHRPVMVVGLAFFMLATVYLTFRWHRLASAAQGPEDAGVLDSLSFYRRQLERQRDARRNWRRRLPVVPGLITVLASFVLELNPIPWALVAIEAILIVGILSFAVVFEEWTARRLQREIDALDSLVVRDTKRY